LRDQIVFFYSPTEIHAKQVAAGTPVRLGGLVKAGTWKKTGDQNEFVVTDGTTDMVARYTGILPDLFREGQGVVIEGAVATDGSFAATNVLAKHDEKYMPKALVDELKAKGEWRPDETGG
jgi:cytochrome c-type biogenesis protein CcmE